MNMFEQVQVLVTWGPSPTPVNGQTDTTENITFATQLTIVTKSYRNSYHDYKRLVELVCGWRCKRTYEHVRALPQNIHN